MILTVGFFAQPATQVAPSLLGQHLVREIDGVRLVGRIVETEAYWGLEDTASHAHRGITPRNRLMFGPPAHAYIYLIYGTYFLLNVVTDPVDLPAAVLIRGVEPVEGLAQMQANRPVRQPRQLTNGPGKLSQALAIDRQLNGLDMTKREHFWFEAAPRPSPNEIRTGPRIGLNSAQPADQQRPWRFC